MLAGMRSGAIALLLKYCLHFPKHTFHWIVLIFTVLIGIFMPNSKIFMLFLDYIYIVVCYKYFLIFLSSYPLTKYITILIITITPIK